VYTICFEKPDGKRVLGRNRPTLKQAKSTAMAWLNSLNETPSKVDPKWTVVVLDNFAKPVLHFGPKPSPRRSKSMPKRLKSSS
jgi:hypothetical protein